MNNDYLNRVLWLVIATIAVLLAAYCLPDMEIGGTQLRRVDLLADLRANPDDDDAVIDSLPTAAVVY